MNRTLETVEFAIDQSVTLVWDNSCIPEKSGSSSVKNVFGALWKMETLTSNPFCHHTLGGGQDHQVVQTQDQQEVPPQEVHQQEIRLVDPHHSQQTSRNLRKGKQISINHRRMREP